MLVSAFKCPLVTPLKGNPSEPCDIGCVLCSTAVEGWPTGGAVHSLEHCWSPQLLPDQWLRGAVVLSTNELHHLMEGLCIAEGQLGSLSRSC